MSKFAHQPAVTPASSQDGNEHMQHTDHLLPPLNLDNTEKQLQHANQILQI